jgi:hypothetical protein
MAIDLLAGGKQITNRLLYQLSYVGLMLISFSLTAGRPVGAQFFAHAQRTERFRTAPWLSVIASVRNFDVAERMRRGTGSHEAALLLPWAAGRFCCWCCGAAFAAAPYL